jgi:hypothetical protein
MRIRDDLESKEIARAIRALIRNGYYSEITYNPEDVDFKDCKTYGEVLQSLEGVRYMDIPERSNFWADYKDDKITLQEDFDEKNELTEDHKEYFVRNKFEGFDTFSEILEVYGEIDIFIVNLLQKELEKQSKE